MESTPLPPLRKRLIFLDQFVIANVLFAVRPDLRRNPTKPTDPLWKEIADALFRTGRAQLVACPPYQGRLSESIVDDRLFAKLQRIYLYLAFGLKLSTSSEIRVRQIELAFRCYLAGEPVFVPTPARDAIEGAIDEWNDPLLHLRIVAYDEGAAANFRKTRDDPRYDLTNLFETWRAEPGISFDVVFERELDAHAAILRELYPLRRDILNFKFPTFAAEVEGLDAVFDQCLSAHGVAEGPARSEIVTRFLDSDAIRATPFVRVSAAIYGALAHEAAHAGRKRRPGRGMGTDVMGISACLPYFDAMLVDDECRRLLELPQAAKEIPWPTRIFSSSTKAEFLAYLLDVESAASDEHRAAVRAVYGEGEVTPEVVLASNSPIVSLAAGRD